MGPARCDALLGELSEIMIDTLKTLSVDAVVITPRMLQKSLAGRQDLIDLLDTGPLPDQPPETPSARQRPVCLDLPKARGSKPRAAASSSDDVGLNRLRELLLDVLGEIEENSGTKDLSALNDIRRDVRETDRMDRLLDQGENIFRMVRSHFNRLSGALSQVTGLLAHIGDGLLEMENCLLTDSARAETVRATDEPQRMPGRQRTDDRSSSPSGRDIRELKSMFEGKLPLIKTMLEQKKQRDHLPPGQSGNMDGARQRITEMRDRLSRARKKTQVLEIELFRDRLTGAYNRRAYKQRISSEFKNFRRNRQDFCVLALEVGNLRNINESFGTPAGDKCLKELAKIIRDSLRGSDFLARCGGDKFTAILPRTSESIIPIITDRLCRNIDKARFHHLQKEFRVTVHMGTAHAIASDQNAEEVCKRAEEASTRSESRITGRRVSA